MKITKGMAVGGAFILFIILMSIVYVVTPPPTVTRPVATPAEEPASTVAETPTETSTTFEESQSPPNTEPTIEIAALPSSDTVVSSALPDTETPARSLEAKTTSPVTTPAPAPSRPVSVLSTLTISSIDLISGIGENVIGKRAYVKISKKDLLAASSEEFKTFLENNYENQDYKYLTIDFGDSTGLYSMMPGGIFWYGELKKDGGVTETTITISPVEDYTYNMADLAKVFKMK